MNCLLKKKEYNCIKWYCKNIEEMGNIYKCKYLILNNSPYYFINEISLENLLNKNNNKKFIKLLVPNERNRKKIKVSCSIHSEKDIIKKLRYGPILQIKWNLFEIEFTYYFYK